MVELNFKKKIWFLGNSAELHGLSLPLPMLAWQILTIGDSVVEFREHIKICFNSHSFSDGVIKNAIKYRAKFLFNC